MKSIDEGSAEPSRDVGKKMAIPNTLPPGKVLEAKIARFLKQSEEKILELKKKQNSPQKRKKRR